MRSLARQARQPTSTSGYDRLIVRVAKAIDLGASPDDIHAMLMGEGLSESDAYLTYRAGQLLSEQNTQENPMRSRARAPIKTFVSVRPGGRVVRYHETPRGLWKRNPIAIVESLSAGDLVLLGLGVGAVGYIGYLLYSASQAPPASPALAVASGGAPAAPQPVSVASTGLATGYYWEDAGNTTTPGFGSEVMVIAMTPDDVAEAIYGKVYIPISPGGNTSFVVTSQSPADPNNGISFGQSVTLPVSYISTAS